MTMAVRTAPFLSRASSIWLRRTSPGQSRPCCRVLAAVDRSFPSDVAKGLMPGRRFYQSGSSRSSAPSQAERDMLVASLTNALGAAKAPSTAAQSLDNLFPGENLLPVEEYRTPDIAVNRPPHHLHILATKHNTHIAFTKPDRDAIITGSTGMLGFRKANRGTYDAAYQLAAWVLNRIQNEGWLRQVEKVEVVFNGFGPGRMAATKALLSLEGRRLRDKVIRITDSTRIKIGGTRSPKPRRL